MDAVVENQTGLLHDPADVDDLVRQIDRLLSDPELRRSMGAAARARAVHDFSPDTLTAAVLEVYARSLDDVMPSRSGGARAPERTEAPFLAESQECAK